SKEPAVETARHRASLGEDLGSAWSRSASFPTSPPPAGIALGWVGGGRREDGAGSMDRGTAECRLGGGDRRWGRLRSHERWTARRLQPVSDRKQAMRSSPSVNVSTEVAKERRRYSSVSPSFRDPKQERDRSATPASCSSRC